jgi:hypothetical protein
MGRSATSDPQEPAVGIPARGYAFAVVSLRYFVIGGWIAALALAFLFLPRLGTSASGGLPDLIPRHSQAARWPGSRGDRGPWRAGSPSTA